MEDVFLSDFIPTTEGINIILDYYKSLKNYEVNMYNKLIAEIYCRTEDNYFSSEESDELNTRAHNIRFINEKINELNDMLTKS